MKKFIGLFIVLCLLNLFAGIGTSGGADTAEFPDIYIDEGCGGTHVGSIANPYDDFADINWTTLGDNSIFDWYAGAEDASVTINLNRGDTWRERLSILGSGSATYPIIALPYGDGANPILNGADILTTWALEGGTVYSKAGITTQPRVVMYDDAQLTENNGATIGVGADEWDWAANVLYVNVGENPDTGMLEAAQRDHCGITNGRDYVEIRNLDMKYTNISGFYITNSSSYITVDSCTISYVDDYGIWLGEGVSYCTINSNIISYTTVEGTSEVGIALAAANHNVISNNDISYCWDGLRLYKVGAVYSNNNTIENNALHDCYDDGIDIAQAQNNIFRNNQSHDNVDDGIKCLTDTLENELYYNISYGNGDYQYVDDGTDNEWYNSVAGEGGADAKTGFAITASCADAIIRNFIFYNNTDHINVAVGGTFTSDYNCFYPDTGTRFWYQGLDYDFADWKTNTGQDADGVNSDPLFIDVAGHDFRLLMASPCINAGTDVGLTRDYRGRSIRHAPDIGAYEDPTNAIFMARLFKYLKEKNNGK